MSTSIGFIGSGNLTAFLTTGFCNAKTPLDNLWITDIDPKRTERIASKFPKQIKIAKDNQSLVDKCQIVILALRPNDVKAALQNLNFGSAHNVISAVALMRLKELQDLLAPCTNIVRIMPLPPVQEHLGTIPYYPENIKVRNILEKLAIPLRMETEDNLNVITAVTCLVAPFYTLLNQTKNWAVEHSVHPETAQSFTVNMFHSLAAISKKSNMDLNDMVNEALTPGGLNEQATNYLNALNSFEPFKDILDIIMQRLENK